jgi:thiamine-monophosphate kinase
VPSTTPSEAVADPQAPTIVFELTEPELIARIHSRLPPAPPWLLVGIGDDAAVVEPERNRVDVLTVDTVVEGIHFDRAFVPPEAIGHRAIAVNLSDLAAMGAAPRLALVAMALPSTLTLDDFDAIVAGMVEIATRHRLHIAGGNLTRSPHPLMIDVTVTGTIKRRQALTRGGARAGDEVWVSGTIGAAAAGLKLLRDPARATGDRRLAAGDRRLVTAYLRPEPRVRLGVLLARNRAATACIDLSDGFADGVHRIAEASGVGMTIDADAIPIDESARATFGEAGGFGVDTAISGGDDYELLFTVRPRARRRVIAAAQQAGVSVTRVGICTDSGHLLMRRGAGETPLPRSGYDHFSG